MRVAGVYPVGVPYCADRRYDYILCDSLASVRRGSLVTVPFGRGNRRYPAVVASLCEREDTEGLKAVLSVEEDRFSLTEELFSLALFLREHTLCPFGDAVRAILPPALLSGGAASHIRTLPRYRPADAGAIPALLASSLRSRAYRQVLEYLSEHPSLGGREAASLGVSPAQLSAMVKHGWLTVEREEEFRNPYAGYREGVKEAIALSRAQQEAYAALLRLYRRHTASAALLFGVTGSGKTRVMMKLMDEVIAAKRQVILMVPEIALTPQTVGIFCRRYGERVAVIHSSLSDGERFDAWRRCREGLVDLVIGTRSAVFAPLPDIGLILLDEEHEHTYKSDADPKYHARDVAAHRAAYHRALVIFASATPSLESFYKAEKGIYTLVPLRERFGGKRLPDAEIVDMRSELRAGNTSPISARLAEELSCLPEAGEQAILFLNRRGYHAVLHCRNCGHIFECPNCSVSMTHHSEARGEYLLCHTCGHREPLPGKCPECGAASISFLGAGTQRAEGELSTRFPTLRVMRMDADTTSTKASYESMLEAFRAGEADVLLGTQMVTKGHDFPRVTLSGVLLADISLHLPDFRAAERTFSLLTQVIGRAGRADRAGHAVIQTYTPENDIIRLACLQDYETFYRREIALRRELLFPPFCDIVQISQSGMQEEKLRAASRELASFLEACVRQDCPKEPMVIYGPFEARIYRSEGKYRLRMIIKCKLNRTTRALFSRILREFPQKGGAVLSVDLNPTDL